MQSKFHATDLEETLLQEGTEEEHWETGQAEALNSIESNSSCTFLYHTLLTGLKTRLVNGKSVYRGMLGTPIILLLRIGCSIEMCSAQETRGCFYQQKMSYDQRFGECNLWEKTYDLGAKAASEQTRASF